MVKCVRCGKEIRWSDSYGKFLSFKDFVCRGCYFIKDNIKRLEEIRRELTEIYMDIGNPDYVSADSVLSQDIRNIKTKRGKK